MIKDSGRIRLDASIMTNFDGSINRKVEEVLKSSFTYATYPARDFCGHVCFEDNKFRCDVLVYHSMIDTIYADTLEDIMEQVSEKYGYE